MPNFNNFLDCPVLYRFGCSKQPDLCSEYILISIVRLNKPFHSNKLVFNQQRGLKRAILASKTIVAEPHKIYQELCMNFKEDVIKYGNVTNIPTKSIFF